MKHILTGAIALATASAFAQSSVTLSGQIDTSVANVRTKNTAGDAIRKTGLFSAGMASSFLRIEGHEDLGGDMYGMFRLETGLNTDSGGGIATNTNNQRTGGGPVTNDLTFNRWAYVGIGSKQWGEVRLGRVYTAAFENFTSYDPFFTNGIGNSAALTLRLGQRNTQSALNVSNAIEYLTPHYNSGLYGRITIAAGENPSNGTLDAGTPDGAGNHVAGRVGYAKGPFAVAFSAGLTRNAAGRIGGTTNNQGDYVNTNLSARYNLGWVRLTGQFVTERLEGATAAGGTLTGNPANEAKTRSILLGATFPVGAGNIKVSYVDARLSDNMGSPEEHGRLIAVGYDYFFSKRTNVYTALTHIRNNAVGTYGFQPVFVSAGRGQSSSGVSFGIKHIF